MPSKPKDQRDRPLAKVFAQQICILGLGVTGLAVVKHYLSLPCASELTVYIDQLSPGNQAAIAELAVEFFSDEWHRLGEQLDGQKLIEFGLTYTVQDDRTEAQPVHHLRIIVGSDEVERHYPFGVVSPGIKPTTPIYESASANCDELVGEPELAYRLSSKRWLAVTGTNGKTTTTSLLNHILINSGRKSSVAGNIGPTLIEAVNQRGPEDWLAVELSSFQLATSSSIAPEAAVLLNITPDHIDWHGSFEEYRDTKTRIFTFMPDNAPTVIDALSEVGQSIIKDCLANSRRVICLGISPEQAEALFPGQSGLETAWVDEDGQLVVRLEGQDIRLLDAELLRIKGTHNRLNALAAAAVAAYIGVEHDLLVEALKSFEPLEHRIEPLGEYQGISFYNDSKATNPEATIMALSAFKPGSIVLLLGGYDKGTDLDDLIGQAIKTSKAVICYGAAGERFYDAFQAALELGPTGQDCALIRASHLSDAFGQALDNATAGDVVLLSPACSSYDEFKDFEERGLFFKGLVLDLGQDSGLPIVETENTDNTAALNTNPAVVKEYTS